MSAYNHLPPFTKDKSVVHAIVETPQGSRHKFKFDPTLQLFQAGSPMPLGEEFPFEFGFIPSTKAEDGDPLDILLLMDAPTFVGCLVSARLVGVIEAEQTEKDGKSERNDRLIAVAENSRRHRDVRTLKDLNAALIEEIEHFFVSYNELKGKRFKVLGPRGPKHPAQLVKKASRAK